MGSVVSQSIPNFLNGMSQQTPTQRGINQGQDQVNLQNGLSLIITTSSHELLCRMLRYCRSMFL